MSHIKKLKELIGESEEIRRGNLSGKKKNVAKKMKRKHRKDEEDWSGASYIEGTNYER